VRGGQEENGKASVQEDPDIEHVTAVGVAPWRMSLRTPARHPTGRDPR
jgi:hypothetical protein